MNFTSVIPLTELPPNSHKTVLLGSKKIALFHYNNKITALGNTCLHKGGDLGQGFIQKLDDGHYYVACPWHGWQYHLVTGKAPHGFKDQQTVYEVKVEGDMIMISDTPVVAAVKAQHEDAIDDLRKLQYQTTPDSLNVLGISTTNLNRDIPRATTSENALERALEFARSEFKAETKLIKLRELKFRHCEGYYSRHERACTWPCSIAEMDPEDGMIEVYRAMVLWADIVILATPIRWGNASSLYYKMVERLNTVQNQITLHDKVLIQNKIASFIVTGGQDNIQQVVGQLNAFFTDLGFIFPPFNFVGWSRGWVAEDMEHNFAEFRKSKYMQRSIKELVTNSILLSRQVKRLDFSDMHTPKPRISEAHMRLDSDGNSG
ncbi:MAG TPA: nitrite reductase (NAD(P)H) small subunit [Saprospiraceae bacterium]|nr:nitrite reductase (NAD(P)H) small subunit [Saprospiraceae bacterium]